LNNEDFVKELKKDSIDLKRKVLRATNISAFSEDPLRILRTEPLFLFQIEYIIKNN